MGDGQGCRRTDGGRDMIKTTTSRCAFLSCKSRDEHHGAFKGKSAAWHLAATALSLPSPHVTAKSELITHWINIRNELDQASFCDWMSEAHEDAE